MEINRYFAWSTVVTTRMFLAVQYSVRPTGFLFRSSSVGRLLVDGPLSVEEALKFIGRHLNPRSLALDGKLVFFRRSW
jgi:hypothetical protein